MSKCLSCFCQQSIVGARCPLLTVQSLAKSIGVWLCGVNVSKTLAYFVRREERPAHFVLQSSRQRTFTCPQQSTNQHQRGSGWAACIAGCQFEQRHSFPTCNLTLGCGDFWLIYLEREYLTTNTGTVAGVER